MHTKSPPEDDPVADLADLLLNVSRLIRARTPSGQGIVPLTETERHVMRVVDLYPGSTPSAIARLTRLQRTNVSTALRDLETKKMITRTTVGRAVTVTATERAAVNLQLLRSAWSTQLAPLISDKIEDICHLNAMLTQLEQRLTSTDSATSTDEGQNSP